MAGTLINVLPKTTYDFVHMTNGTLPLTPIAGPVDALPYTNVALLLRIHAISIDPGTSNKIVFSVCDDGYIEGSSVPYVSKAAVASTVLDENSSAPSLLSSSGFVIGQYLSLALSAVRNAAGAIKAT